MVITTHSPRWTQPLDHPGAPSAVRRNSIGTHSRSKQVVLEPGALITDALAQAVESLGATCGQVELLDGFLSNIDYCHPVADVTGQRQVSYSRSLSARAPARIIAGSATVGYRDGDRFTHCHAGWIDADGEIKGGHLWPTTRIGTRPIHAIVHTVEEAELINTIDSESGLPAFVPHRRLTTQPATGDGRRAVISRLAPGVNLDTAIRDIMAEEGFARASIAGSLGSLVGAVFHRDLNFLVVDGPATEVTLTGDYDLRNPVDPRAILSGMAIDCQGRVYAGEFVAEESVVACTMELFVREIM